MDNKNTKTQCVHIRFDLLNRFNKLRADLSTAEKRVKVKHLIEEALESYLEKKGG